MVYYFGADFLQVALLVALPKDLIGASTPSDIEKLFKQACADTNQTSAKCNQGWVAFEAAFAGKNWNTSTLSDYYEYLEVFPIPADIKDRALFWTRTKLLQEALAHRAGLYSSSTLTACQIVNLMIARYNVSAWCGDSRGIDYTSTNCPLYQPNTPTYTFFAAFSEIFAKNSSGTVFFLTENTLANTSIFTTVELPALLLNPEVKKIVVLNVFPSKACNQAPLTVMEQMMKNSNSKKEYLCVDIVGNVSESGLPSQSLLDALEEVVMQQSSGGAVCHFQLLLLLLWCCLIGGYDFLNAIGVV